MKLAGWMLRAIVGTVYLLIADLNPSRATESLVRVEIIDRDLPFTAAWPQQPNAPTECYTEEAFGFFHVPWRYAETGVRADRGNPYLLRATGNVPLPAGKIRLLLRARGAARLWINGQRVVELPFPKPISDGHDPLRTDALVLGQTRFIAPGDREKLLEYDAPGGTCRVVLETVVGGLKNKKPLRPELGETLAAFALAGSDEFRLLAPRRIVALTDAGWEAYTAERAHHYEHVEATRRHAARAAHADFWRARHDTARRHAQDHPVPLPPAGTTDTQRQNPIDQFLGHKLARARAVGQREQGDVRFHRDVLPLLASRCFSCHASKPKGGLRLDSAEAARRGGDSGTPALVPGQAEKSLLLRRVRSTEHGERMPPKGDPLKPQEIAVLEQWIRAGAAWPDEEPVDNVTLTPLTGDLEFLRRVSLDVRGTVPTTAEARAFLADGRPNKRRQLIDRFLEDPRWADVWTPRWQDLLAENPNLVNATLNNTGPFRWWLYESFRDNKPMDLFTTELVMLGGSPHGGGPAGFGIAAQNDAPWAAKAGILAAAFLGTEMKCARCHDAPYHPVRQADLFGLAALLARTPVTVPKTSSVPLDKLHTGGRVPLIKVTLKPGAQVSPAWPLEQLVSGSTMRRPSDDTRAWLADLVTAPQNERFAEVLVNRVWQHFFGRGLVEPLSDWENARPTHPELLRWLAREFVSHNYDLKYVSRLILTSNAYQRRAATDAVANRLYAAPARRRLSAEQLVDSLVDAFGVPLDTGLLCIDLDGGRPAELGLNFGRPRRAWQFVSTANDRDRPSLNLPRAQAVTELMMAFGWQGNRQEAVADRKLSPSILQPALLANGTVSRWLTRLSDRSAMTRLCLEDRPVEDLVREVFLRVLTRWPTADELRDFSDVLRPGYQQRVRNAAVPAAPPRQPRPYVSWANHLVPEANQQRQLEEREARAGPPPTSRLDDDWRQRMEDVLWALLNAPELVFIP